MIEENKNTAPQSEDVKEQNSGAEVAQENTNDTAASEKASESTAKAQAPKKEGKGKAKDLSAKAAAEKLQKQLDETKDALLRTAAEYENFRKRSTREKDASFSGGIAHAVEKLLPVIDTLSLALSTQTEDANYKKGVEMTFEQCKRAFDALGVKEIEALDAQFDPNLHAAVMQQPAPEGKESGTVLQVLQPGYTLGDKVIRHATVMVAE